jgi:hypothetical protein
MGGNGLLEWWYAAMVSVEGLDDAMSSATLGSVGRAVVGVELSCSRWPRRCQSLSMVGMGRAGQRGRRRRRRQYEANGEMGYTGQERSFMAGREQVYTFQHSLLRRGQGGRALVWEAQTIRPHSAGRGVLAERRCMRAK